MNDTKRASGALGTLAGCMLLALPAAASDVPSRLHDTGLFVGSSSTQIRADNLPFSPQYPLWTDGAVKRRWIRLPKGAQIDASSPDTWRFPVGTRLWKEFSFGKRIETRYLELRPNGRWIYAAYVWNEDGTDALLAPERGLAVALADGGTHMIPGAADCRACHEGRPTPVLGFSALQLSSDRDPLAPHAEPAHPGDLDLPTLLARRVLRGLPRELAATPPRIAATSETARAALGYLHANCGHCHNEEGPLAPIGMSLAQGLGDGESSVASVVRTTAHQESRFRVPGWKETFRIVPGRPEQSAVTFRMRAHDPLTRMPPLGTNVTDAEGLALIERWITQDLPEPHPTRKDPAP